MSSMVYLKDVVTLRMNPERCVGCGMCLVVCPHEVFGMHEGRASIRRRDACMECGACAQNCPTEAIEVQVGVGCAAAVINSLLGRDSASCCCVIESKDGDQKRASCC